MPITFYVFKINIRRNEWMPTTEGLKQENKIQIKQLMRYDFQTMTRRLLKLNRTWTGIQGS